MRKTIKILFIISLLFVIFFSFNVVKATEEDTETVQEEDDEGAVIQETTSDQSSLSVFSPSYGTKVSNQTSYEQANLKLNNVLSIILIAIGILLILFAIAILIRISR